MDLKNKEHENKPTKGSSFMQPYFSNPCTQNPFQFIQSLQITHSDAMQRSLDYMAIAYKASS